MPAPGLKRRYVAGEITLDEYEAQVGEALDPTPRRYAERWEIHVHNAPAGHSLHIHLP